MLKKKVVMVNCKLKFWQDQPLLVTVLQITILALLLLALTCCLVTIGVFGKQWNDTKKNLDPNDNTDVCFLYLSKKDGFGKDSYCNYTVYGQGIVAVALLILLVLLAVIVFLRLRFGIDLIAFLVIAVITFIFSLIESIVLSDGFAKSCSTIKEITSNYIKCSDALGKDIYDALQSSTACSWIETLVICAILIVTCVYASTRMSKRSGYIRTP